MLTIPYRSVANLTGMQIGPWAPIYVTVGLATLTASGWVLFARQRRRLWIDRELTWLLWHWFTGGPLESARSFPCEDHDHNCARRRALLGAMRTTCIAGIVACEYVRSGAPSGTNWAMAAWAYGGTIALAASVVLLAHLAVRAAVQLWWVRPIAATVRKRAGWPEDRPAWRFVKFRRVRGHWGLGVKVIVSPDCDLSELNLERIVEATKIVAGADLGKVDHRWNLTGRSSHVMFLPAAQLPDRVPFSDPDVRRLMERAKPSAPIIGLGKDGVPIAPDLDSDSPHLLLSAGTGGGKSSTIRAVAAHMLWHGAEIDIVDVKRHSHPWARGLPGVRYARDIEEINRLLVDLGTEADRRNQEADRLQLGETAGFTRRVLVCEELNGTMDRLSDWWAGRRGTCPGVQALRSLLFMGRAVQIHVLAVAQQATARSLGGGEARENFAVRILAAPYSHRTWNMLIPQFEYLPAISHQGWAVIASGTDLAEVQRLWITEHEAHNWLTTKLPTPTHHSPLPNEGYVPTATDPSVQEIEAGTVPAETDDVVDFVTLREYTDREGVSLSLGAIKRARSRDPEFPVPAIRNGSSEGDRFLLEALERWERNRPRAAKNRQSYEPLVYFIVSGGQPRYGDVVKIGKTTNLEQRLDSFAAHPHDVVLTLPMRSENHMSETERELHERWRAYRIYRNRELFRIEGGLADYLGIHQEVPV